MNPMNQNILEKFRFFPDKKLNIIVYIMFDSFDIITNLPEPEQTSWNNPKWIRMISGSKNNDHSASYFLKENAS